MQREKGRRGDGVVLYSSLPRRGVGVWKRHFGMGSCQNAAGLTGCGRSESDAEGEFELVVAEFGVDLGGGHGFRHGGILVVVEVLVLVGELVEVGDVGVEVAEVEPETSGDGLQGVVAVQVAFGVGRRPIGVACPQAEGAREAEFRSGPEIVGAAVDLLYHVVGAEDVGVLVRHVAVIVVAVAVIGELGVGVVHVLVVEADNGLLSEDGGRAGDKPPRGLQFVGEVHVGVVAPVESGIFRVGRLKIEGGDVIVHVGVHAEPGGGVDGQSQSQFGKRPVAGTHSEVDSRAVRVERLEEVEEVQQARGFLAGRHAFPVHVVRAEVDGLDAEGGADVQFVVVVRSHGDVVLALVAPLVDFLPLLHAIAVGEGNGVHVLVVGVSFEQIGVVGETGRERIQIVAGGAVGLEFPHVDEGVVRRDMAALPAFAVEVVEVGVIEAEVDVFPFRVARDERGDEAERPHEVGVFVMVEAA